MIKMKHPSGLTTAATLVHVRDEVTGNLLPRSKSYEADSDGVIAVETVIEAADLRDLFGWRRVETESAA